MCIRDRVYTEEEMEAVEGHIQQYFGKFGHVFHELSSPDIHVDICVVPPSQERDYYTPVSYTHLDVYKRQIQRPCLG